MFEVRLATPQDANVIFDIARDFATSFDIDRGTFDSSFGCLLERHDAWLGVAQAPSGVMGYLLGFDHVTFFANGRVSWVEEVAVEERWRRHGIGTSLTERFEEWARSRGSKLCALATVCPRHQESGPVPLGSRLRGVGDLLQASVVIPHFSRHINERIRSLRN